MGHDSGPPPPPPPPPGETRFPRFCSARRADGETAALSPRIPCAPPKKKKKKVEAPGPTLESVGHLQTFLPGGSPLKVKPAAPQAPRLLQRPWGSRAPRGGQGGESKGARCGRGAGSRAHLPQVRAGRPGGRAGWGRGAAAARLVGSPRLRAAVPRGGQGLQRGRREGGPARRRPPQRLRVPRSGRGPRRTFEAAAALEAPGLFGI